MTASGLLATRLSPPATSRAQTVLVVDNVCLNSMQRRVEWARDHLSGRVFERREWWRFRPDWDHDNCEICATPFSDRPVRARRPPPIVDGFVTADDHYYWVCIDCFDLHRDAMGWAVQEASTPDSRRRSWPCSCCGYLTLHQKPPGTYQICPVCGWEDDGYQARHPDALGANKVSLRQARENLASIGAKNEASLGRVREPWPEEHPGPVE